MSLSEEQKERLREQGREQWNRYIGRQEQQEIDVVVREATEATKEAARRTR